MTTATLPTRHLAPVIPVEAPGHDHRLGDVGDSTLEALLDAAALLAEQDESEA